MRDPLSDNLVSLGNRLAAHAAADGIVRKRRAEALSKLFAETADLIEAERECVMAGNLPKIARHSGVIETVRSVSQSYASLAAAIEAM